MRIVATAGHVDHGKSSLVRALTGTDPDRWPEEKERGLTIDLGFATTALPSGPVAFVDVPGHERFLGTMLAGVGAVDAVLLVVSAAEGWKAQSEEHLAIVEVLGIAHGVVALTHADRVDLARRAEVEAHVRARLRGGPLAAAEVVATAVPTGAGLADLADALDRLVRTTPAPPDHGRPRLWVDRAFTIRGAGTVVTGTLTGGGLVEGRTVVTAPGGRTSRIRAIQVHDRARPTVGPGHRVALNVPDLSPADGRRGVALIEPDRWLPTTVVDATLSVLATAPRPITRRGAHLLHTGTGAWAVRLHVLHDRAIAPGTQGDVRIRLPQPLPLRPGDHFVLRDAGADLTVGGGTVLDLDPILPPGRARPDRSWRRVVAEHGWIDASHLELLTGVPVAPTVGSWVVAPEALDAAADRLRHELRAAGPGGLRRSALDDRARALVQASLVPDVVVDADSVRLAEHDHDLDHHPWLVRLVGQPFQPPPPQDVPADEVDALVRRRLVFVREGIHFPQEAVPEALARLGPVAAAHPEGFTVADARVALGTTRRFALPLLLELDARGLSRRDGGLRTLVAPPRGPAPGARPR